MVRTPDFHSGNGSSILLGITKITHSGKAGSIPTGATKGRNLMNLSYRYRRHYNYSSGDNTDIFVGLGCLGFFIGIVAAWITHLWWTLGLLMSDTSHPVGHYILAILGVLLAPFGALYGVWLRFH